MKPAFANIHGRPKWAIPWMENDPNLVAYQPWAGRMRHDAVDAKRLGCDGLLGIHWRTKALAATVSALAGVPGTSRGFLPLMTSRRSRALTRILRSMGRSKRRWTSARCRSASSTRISPAPISAPPSPRRPARSWLPLTAPARPNPSDWLTGPGDLKTDATPLEQVQKRFQHVARFAALRGKVAGAGNLERFDYWLSTLKLNALMCEIAGIRGQLAAAVKKIDAEKTAGGKQRPPRRPCPSALPWPQVGGAHGLPDRRGQHAGRTGHDRQS